MKFAKAHGLGNDFILVPEAQAPSGADAVGPWARRLCDRHEGIGGDGILLYGLEPGAVTMRLINADGTDGEVSGNGVRCLAAYVVARGQLEPRHVVRTPPGPRPVEVARLSGTRFRVVTDLGPAILASAQIPVMLPQPQARVVDHELTVGARRLRITATSLGNPHCAVFVDRPPDEATLAEIGSALETHAFFPRRTNVELITVLSPHELRVRFWERGVGYTRASGTGAASAAVAAILRGAAESPVLVRCDGGALEVEWPGGTSHLRQTGEVELLFEGEWLAG